MILLQPTAFPPAATPNPESRIALSDPTPASPEPTPASLEPIADSPIGDRDSVRHYRLERYPDYEFLSDGTPIMIRQPVRGPRAHLGPLTPLYTSRTLRTFTLRVAGGGREVKSDRQIRELIKDDSTDYTDLFTISRFPSLRFDSNGTAYSLQRRAECAHTVSLDTGGFPVKHYKLYSPRAGTPRIAYITDAQIRRILCGKAGEEATIIPDHFKPFNNEFPDYAFDPESFELYRIGRRCGTLLEPKLVRMARNARQYVMTRADGRILRNSRKKVLEMAGIDETHPHFAYALSIGSRIGE
jgi:hypothetical protein